LTEQVVSLLKGLPAEAVVFLIATVPIAELRGAIPWALTPPPLGGGLSWQEAYIWSVMGNLLPVPFLLWLLEPLSERLRRWGPMDRFLGWLFARTRRRGKLVERYGPLGLVLFVGVPLPVTGAWTGAVAAFIFGVPFRRALPAIAFGVMLAGVVVTLASLGVLGAVRALF